ncbi:MAG: LON peptidase substrate-binding domain-containing protein [Hyphomonadaceae bacterium]
MSLYGYRKPTDLPRAIPIFPLSGAILFPRGTLPLNIFEPRYLNMIDDALAGDRVIGMIQPAGRGAPIPPILDIGTLGRITAFAETEDGRYLITLTGIARFRVAQEIESGAPYRKVIADYSAFADDFDAGGGTFDVDRTQLADALMRYSDAMGFKIDWSAVEEAAPEALVHAVASLCPFDPIAKQALLEAPTLSERAAALIVLLESGAEDAGRGTASPMQ